MIDIRRRIIVCGTRDWDDVDTLQVVLHKYFTDGVESIMVHGDCATGADWLAQGWANKYEVDVEAPPADWKKYGHSAGPRRNQEMADAGAALCLAFWNGRSSGTLNMIQCATRQGIPVRIIPPRSLARLKEAR